MSEYDINLEESYRDLEGLFEKALTSMYVTVQDDILLAEDLEDFIVTLGKDVKSILQKYHTISKIQELEVKDAQEQLLLMKRKSVKMELQFKKIQNAINGFAAIKQS